MPHSAASDLSLHCLLMSHKKHTRLISGLQIIVCTGKLFSYFSTKTYVVGTQKNRLDETVLLSTQNTCLSKEINAI